jgi:choline dehydrogenase-like flavoprotein
MRDYDRLAMVANTIGSPQRGLVDSKEQVDFRFDDEDMRVVRDSAALTVRSLLQAGAEEVRLAGLDDTPSFVRGDSARSIDQRLRRIAAMPSQLMLTSAHPQGGLRMDREASRGAVDEDFALHAVSNVFVADASVFPSTVVVNPQWTVMALAQVAAEQIERRLRGVDRERCDHATGCTT